MQPDAVYTAAQVRTLDRLAIEAGVPGAVLMTRAGEAALRLLIARWPRARRLTVVCGPGNNGGDGYVLARMACSQGLIARVATLGAAPKPGSDAARMRSECQAAGVAMDGFAMESLAHGEVIVDALLGTGLERPLEGEWRAAITAINESRRPVLAIDLPSGLNADTGQPLGVAVRASVTLTFVGPKLGLYTGAGRDYCGEIVCDGLGIPPDIYARVAPAARRLSAARLAGEVRRRARHAHKGDCGRVLVIGGERGMPGAVRLAGEAAYRAGAGLVTIATHPCHASALNAARPELIVHGVTEGSGLRPLLARADVIALGPGLGRSPWSQGLFAAALEARAPLVLDADALNLLAAEPAQRADWILTPHPGEAARLLGGAATVPLDRLAAVLELKRRYGGVCVLKGAGTLIAAEEGAPVELCDRGNPGLASGGTGDVLTGILAALRAQGLSSPQAARVGVWAHATAADAAAAEGEIGLLATDLLAPLRRVLNRLGAHP